MRDEFPLPDTTWETTAGFWTGAARGALSLPRCDACRRIDWYPHEECRECGGTARTWTDLSGDATVFTWNEVVRPFLPQYADLAPYLTGLVTIAEDERVRLATRFVDVDPSTIKIGMPVRVTFRPLRFTGVEGEVVAPLFTPA